MTKASRKAMDEAIERGTALKVEQFDGAVVIDASVRLTQTRWETRILRARPGTFEWRYGRKSADTALYHAGIRYAELWEMAGTASAKSPDMESGSGGQWRGLPDGRAVAMSEVKHAVMELGKLVSSRLTAYCVAGNTTAELAKRFGIPDRDMAAVLHLDLTACAVHFRYL